MTDLNEVINKPLLTLKEVGEILSLSKDTVYNLLRAGKLKGYKLNPKAWRVKKEDLTAFIESKKV